jgi:hypothetical protein
MMLEMMKRPAALLMAVLVVSRAAYAIPWANPRAIANPPAQDKFGLRLSGGYGLSENTSTGYDSGGKASVDPQSQGIASGAELYWAPQPRLQLGLGVFPDFVTRSVPSSYYNTPTLTLMSTVITSNINFLPVILSLYMKQPLGDGFGLMMGVGAGVVPATSYTPSASYGNNAGGPVNLDAGLALRGVLGVDKTLGNHFNLGLQVQVLSLSPKPVGTSSTDTVDQVAPMLSLDTHF